jgi:hypothetical protein
LGQPVLRGCRERAWGAANDRSVGRFADATDAFRNPLELVEAAIEQMEIVPDNTLSAPTTARKRHR